MIDLTLCSGVGCKKALICLRAYDYGDQNDNYFETPPCSKDGLTCESFIQRYCYKCSLIINPDGKHDCEKDRKIKLYDVEDGVDWKRAMLSLLYNLAEAEGIWYEPWEGFGPEEMKTIEVEYDKYCEEKKNDLKRRK